jgi:hypothetical protein
MTDPYIPLVQDLVPLNEVKYAARDYPSIFDSLLRRLKIVYADTYNDFATTTQGIMLMEMISYACDALQFYLDRTASDCFLQTARTRAATSRLTEQIGYKMTPAAASGTTLRLTFPDGSPGGFTMGARWRYQGPESMQYESFADVTVPGALAPGDELDVDVRQGQSRLLTFTADGSKNQTYRMTNVGENQYVAETSVQVWVDGSEWEEKDFLEYEKTNHFEVSYLAAPPLVRFGDGSAGNIPPQGAEVKVRYLVIEGFKGNVKADTITSSIDTLAVLGETVNFTVTNPDGSTGGTDPEESDQAKVLAPRYFAARGAAITQQDYEALAQSFTDPTYGSVAKSYALNPRGTYDDIIFNGYISTIEALLSVYRTSVDSLENEINDTAASLSPILTQMTTDILALANMRITMLTYCGSAIVQVDSAELEGVKAETNGTLAVTNLSDLQNGIDGLEGYIDANVGNTITGTVYDDLMAQVAELTKRRATASDRAQDAATAGGVAAAASQTALDQLNPLNYLLTETSPTPPDETMSSLISSILSGKNDIGDAIVLLQADALAMDGAAATLESDIAVVLADMHLRIGELFADDCMSNYVQVPILALDVEGNYTSPSVGLITALQAYLDGIKEVTQQVEVVDGSPILLPAEIEVDVRVHEAYVEAEVVSAIETTIIGLLKGRNFNQPLYVSDLYDNVMASSNGISYVNIDIVGPTTWVPNPFDSEGNLIGQPSNIITLGSLTTNVVGA